jgi:hypothetical protein
MSIPDYILLDITLRSLPPSINNLYETVNGRRKKSERGNDFTRLAVDCIQLENRGFTIPVDVELDFFLVCYYPFPKDKRDRLNMCDSDNPLKIAKDSVFAATLMDTGLMRRAKDNQVVDDYTKKRRGNPQTLKLYPYGYCRILLTSHGHALEILPMLEKEVG